MSFPFHIGLLAPLVLLSLTSTTLAAEPVSASIADLRHYAGIETSDGLFATLTGDIVAKTDLCQILDDGSGRILIYCNGSDMPFSAGDKVLVSCTVWENTKYDGLQAGNVSCSRLLSHGKEPPPLDTTAAEIVAGKHALRLVRTRGIVTHVFRDEVDASWLDFVIETPRSHFIAVLHNHNGVPMERALALIDREVVLSGIANSPLGSSNPHAVDVPSLVLRTFDDVRVAKEPAFDADRHPHRQTVTGTVISPCGENSFFLAPDEGGKHLKVRLFVGEAPAVPGEALTVAGFVHHNAFHSWLDNAVIRRRHGCPRADRPPAVVKIENIISNVNGSASFNLAYQGTLVRIFGTVTDASLTAKSERIANLESGGFRLPIHLGDIPAPPVGSKIAVCGGCLIVTETDDGPARFCRFKGVEIFPRSAADIEILSDPPWWTPLRLAAVILCLVLTLIGISIWNRLLKKIIARQSDQLIRTRLAKERSALRTKERTMLAIELHDSLSQNLTGVGLQLTASRRARPSDPDAAERHVAAALRILKSSRIELDRCIQDLRNNALDETDFPTAIRQTLGPAYAESVTALRFNVDRNRLDDRTAHAVLRIIRELVANAVGHGHATEIRIAGEISTGALKFSVSDNGVGFPLGHVPDTAEGHFGLAGIRERVKEMKGSVVLHSRPGKGARIAVVLPFPNTDSIHNAGNEENQDSHRG